MCAVAADHGSAWQPAWFLSMNVYVYNYNSVIQVVYSKLDRVTVLKLLHEHLQQSIVRLRGKYHLQSNGIPQVKPALSLLSDHIWCFCNA